jgi:hypothetical protein
MTLAVTIATKCLLQILATKEEHIAEMSASGVSEHQPRPSSGLTPHKIGERLRIPGGATPSPALMGVDANRGVTIVTPMTAPTVPIERSSRSWVQSEMRSTARTHTEGLCLSLCPISGAAAVMVMPPSSSEAEERAYRLSVELSRSVVTPRDSLQKLSLNYGSTAVATNKPQRQGLATPILGVAAAASVEVSSVATISRMRTGGLALKPPLPYVAATVETDTSTVCTTAANRKKLQTTVAQSQLPTARVCSSNVIVSAAQQRRVEVQFWESAAFRSALIAALLSFDEPPTSTAGSKSQEQQQQQHNTTDPPGSHEYAIPPTHCTTAAVTVLSTVFDAMRLLSHEMREVLATTSAEHRARKRRGGRETQHPSSLSTTDAFLVSVRYTFSCMYSTRFLHDRLGVYFIIPLMIAYGY